ncbi:hypothetical protein ACVWZ6_004558 [Bradyrhizobium sp. GM6.1]
METIRRLRAMASLCRQTSAHYPDRSWKLLAEAEFWEHLAKGMLREHFEQCTAGSSLPPIGDDPNTAESSAHVTA